MAESITFSNDQINLATTTGGNSTTILNGTLVFSYGGGNVTGSLTDTAGNIYSNFTLQNIGGADKFIAQTTTGAYGLYFYYPGTMPSPSSVTVESTLSNQSGIIAGAVTNGVLVTSTMVCFVSGTRIHTLRGNVAVEDLQEGDKAITASGDIRPIVWIGHRAVELRQAHNSNAMPVRIAAHSFGDHLPERDLYLSPGHPVLVGADDDGTGGHLVPIMCLINGTTIKRVPVDTVTYWHVELDAHDILLAEGLPAESYLDWGDRGFFTEDSDHALHNPDFVVPGLAARCRPVALDGPMVEAERRRLDAVFAWRLAAACDWPTEHGAMPGL